jgi:hypothetical protein
MKDNKPTSGEVLAKLKKLGIADEVEFYFLPSPELKRRIIRGDDPIIAKLPYLARKIFLELKEGQGVALYTPMVLKYIDGTLDEKNSYIFDLGEIRIRNEHDIMIKALNRAENLRKISEV